MPYPELPLPEQNDSFVWIEYTGSPYNHKVSTPTRALHEYGYREYGIHKQGDVFVMHKKDAQFFMEQGRVKLTDNPQKQETVVATEKVVDAPISEPEPIEPEPESEQGPILDFTSIEGISDEVALALMEAGYTTINAFENVTAADLAGAVAGVGLKKAEKILLWVASLTAEG